MPKRALTDKPEVQFETAATLRDWLAENGAESSGIWAVTFKKAAGDRHLPSSEVVDACLCYGWVDSLPRSKDDARTMLYISPRKPGSNWSRVNKEKVARLTDAGLMTSAGKAVIDRSKADGSWSALDDVENLVIPPDLQAGFDDTPGARENWDAFPRSVRRGALEIVLNAKQVETRTAKIAQIVSDSAANKRPFQWRGKGGAK